MIKRKTGVSTPQANLAINKSRIKLYCKNSQVPTYYLKKGQEFEIELFNPTKDNIMAKISLNGKPIAQGGLVLKPGVRYFLDRYIDVARKFKFDTYEVGNSSEVKKAIEDNGDFKVEFYKEETLGDRLNKADTYFRNGRVFNSGYTNISSGTNQTNVGRPVQYGANYTRGIVGTSNTFDVKSVLRDTEYNTTSNLVQATLDMVDMAPLEELSRRVEPTELKTRSRKVLKKKSIETGRVEEGSRSEQTLDTVYMNWESYPFHTLEYKMLPVSQKINTVEGIQVKRYCSSCAAKIKPTFKFCSSCGGRV